MQGIIGADYRLREQAATLRLTIECGATCPSLPNSAAAEQALHRRLHINAMHYSGWNRPLARVENLATKPESRVRFLLGAKGCQEAHF
jgi:hypothetical protein